MHNNSGTLILHESLLEHASTYVEDINMEVETMDPIEECMVKNITDSDLRKHLINQGELKESTYVLTSNHHDSLTRHKVVQEIKEATGSLQPYEVLGKEELHIVHRAVSRFAKPAITD
ncbi:hypothetical protein SUGI_0514080 [Cryptomeria japonica]|nr:hypothetical protein SUGI_0514080 [Cryptomeria japonica]